MVGCIPVIIADEIELPYENYLDWSQLVIKVRNLARHALLPLPAVFNGTTDYPAQCRDRFTAVRSSIAVLASIALGTAK